MYEENVPLNNVSAAPALPPAQEKLSFWSLLALIVLLPLFFLPSVNLSILVAKNSLLTMGVLLTTLFFLIGVLRDGKITIPRTYMMWLVILIPLAYLAASFTSISRQLSFFGYTLEVGTFASAVLLFALLALTSLILNTKNRIYKVYGGMFLGFLIIGIFALIKLFSGGNLLVLKNFSGSLGNPIGNWTDYSIYFALFSVLSVSALEWLQIKRPFRFFLYISLLVSVFMLAVINFSIAWILTLLGGAFILLYSVYGSMGKEVTSGTKSNLYKAKYAIGLTVLSLLFVINPTISSTTGTLGNSISGIFGIQNSEVRPSWGATLDVTKPILKSDALLGSGPNTFGREWLLNKPAVINGTAFWNVAFPFGVGFIPTQLASTGIIGGVLWLLFLAMFLILGIKALLKIVPNEGDKFMVVSSFLGSLILWVSAILYVPSLVMLSLAFVLTGLFIAALTQSGIIGERSMIFSGSPKKNILALMLVVLVLIGAGSIGFKIFQKTVSVVYFQKALVAANDTNRSTDELKSLIVKANSFAPADLYYRALSTLAFNKAQGLVNQPNPTPATAQEFQIAYGEAIESAKTARDLSPENYENWFNLGGLYEALVPVPVTSAYENAKIAYEEARKLNPGSPEIPLVLARLEASNKNLDSARKYIEESIALKNDYAAAYFLLARLEISANNMANAIKAAEAGAILSPGNAGVYFELGLLKYTNKDYQGAVDAFVAALKVVPEYANAQYFLGLSLYELGDKANALQVFQMLQKSNPDNAEVQSIITNLEAGKAPFFPTVNKNVGPAAKTNPPLESAPAR